MLRLVGLPSGVDKILPLAGLRPRAFENLATIDVRAASVW